MVIDEIIFIYTNIEDREEVEEVPTSHPIAIEYLDYNSKLSRRRSRLLLEEWGGNYKSIPFAILKENGKVVKCLYTEDKNRVIKDLKTYL